MKHPRNIFLVGPMGAGKSAVGRQLARALHLAFADSDDEVESRTGVDIPFIFEKEGEAGFRKREAAAIDDLTKRDGVVLATGGVDVDLRLLATLAEVGRHLRRLAQVVGPGTALVVPESRSRLGGRGFVIYLYTSVDQQLSRTNKGRERPLLETGDRRETLETLLEQRDPMYREIADLVVDTNGRKVNSVAKEIIDSIT